MHDKKLTIWLTFTLTSFEDMRKLFFAYFPNEIKENFNQYSMEFKKNGISICLRYDPNPLSKAVSYKRYYTNQVKSKIGV